MGCLRCPGGRASIYGLVVTVKGNVIDRNEGPHFVPSSVRLRVVDFSTCARLVKPDLRRFGPSDLQTGMTCTSRNKPEQVTKSTVQNY
jgi:hypothetical protein